MSRPRDEKGVKVVLFDEAVHVNVGEGLARIRAPVTKQTRLDVFSLEWFSQQRVGFEVEHAQAQVQACVPVGLHLLNLIFGQGLALDGGASLTKRRELGHFLVERRRGPCSSSGCHGVHCIANRLADCER